MHGGMAARLAAVSMDIVEKSNLRQIINEHEEQFQTKPETVYFRPRADMDFHHAIIRGSRNPIIYNFLCKDLYPLFQLCRRLHQNAPGRGRQALREHIRILEAIEEGDFEMAEIMMQHHIAASRRCVETIFANQDVKSVDPELLNSRPSLLRWENFYPNNID
jgi:DNA-binding GntR family transcriptional regulator